MTGAVLEPGGVLSRSLSEYEDRPGQRHMAEVVARALDGRGMATIEAGTGTGKTLAYLVPAVSSGLRVVISTGTRALQDQLASVDIPLVAELVDEPFDHAVVKGTSNYLCRRRLQTQLVTLHAKDRSRELERIETWARHTPTGDRAEIDFLPDDSPAWASVSTSADGRLGGRCPHFERCFVTHARRRAEGAHIVIVNHHLFFADLALRQSGADARVLPDYDAVIFDEAHLIEGALTEHFAPAISTGAIARYCRELSELGGPYPDSALAKVRNSVDGLERAWNGLANDIRVRLGDGPGRRHLPDDLFAAEVVERSWYGVDDCLGGLSMALAAIADDDEDHPHAAESELFGRRARGLRNSLAAIADSGDHRFARFGEARGSGLTLKAAPIDVSDLFRDWVIDGGSAVILTSATLTCSGQFDHLRTQLGIAEDRADEVQIESPFSYQDQALLYVAGDLPDPRHADYTATSIARMAELIDITGGRTLVLFTSHRQLGRAAQSLPEWLEVPVLVQGQAPAAQLLEQFRRDHESVLLATGTFWQGIDVPGPALSQVIIDKLPFAPPDDPLAGARARLCEERGGEPFYDYQLPEAVTVFRQGAGRLIRRRDDRGLISVLDSRILGKRYGKAFIDSLPEMPRTASLERARRFWDV